MVVGVARVGSQRQKLRKVACNGTNLFPNTHTHTHTHTHTLLLALADSFAIS